MLEPNCPDLERMHWHKEVTGSYSRSNSESTDSDQSYDEWLRQKSCPLNACSCIWYLDGRVDRPGGKLGAKFNNCLSLFVAYVDRYTGSDVILSKPNCRCSGYMKGVPRLIGSILALFFLLTV